MQDRPTSPPPGATGFGPLPSKWSVLPIFWIFQGAGVYVLGALWVHLTQSASKAAIFGELPTLREFATSLFRRDMMTAMGTYVVVLTALQAVLLLPVRNPAAAKRELGAALWASIGVAGLAIAGVWIGALVSVASLIALAHDNEPAWVGDILDRTEGGAWTLLVPLLVSWAFATPLLVAFCRRGRRDTHLARLSTRILQGTAVEVVAIIPLDVMIRRRTDCYCSSGTFWALLLCGTVGVLLAGPATFLTVVTRRRRWYADQCEVCGYDMTGLRNADRCPECGCGWAAAPAGTAGGVNK